MTGQYNITFIVRSFARVERRVARRASLIAGQEEMAPASGDTVSASIGGYSKWWELLPQRSARSQSG